MAIPTPEAELPWLELDPMHSEHTSSPPSHGAESSVHFLMEGDHHHVHHPCIKSSAQGQQSAPKADLAA